MANRRRPAAPASASTIASVESAREAGLRWTTDSQPGIRRLGPSRSPRYVGPDGRPIRDPEIVDRARRLAVPPAWTDVWINHDPRGHIQATGRDARGRKQYRYHPRWRRVRDEAKFERTVEFARRLPRLRARIERDLSRPGIPRAKVVALVVRLLELTLIRVGNDEYARANRSFGLTTLRDRHAEVAATRVRFRFRGKGGRLHEIGLRDRRLARIIRRCQELPGQELFQYVDEDGNAEPISSEDVNEYIHTASGGEFTAKDFRTWAATVLAHRELRASRLPGRTASRRDVDAAIRAVAARLGHSPAVCRQSYVHPGIVDAYLAGSLGAAVAGATDEVAVTADEEALVLADLRRQLRVSRGSRRVARPKPSRVRSTRRETPTRTAPGEVGPSAR